MSTLTITLDHVCPGGNHFTLGAVVNGQAKHIVQTTRDDLIEPLTEDELEAAIKVLIRLRAIGKTKLQVRNNLQTGLAVTI